MIAQRASRPRPPNEPKRRQPFYTPAGLRGDALRRLIRANGTSTHIVVTVGQMFPACSIKQVRLSCAVPVREVHRSAIIVRSPRTAHRSAATSTTHADDGPSGDSDPPPAAACVRLPHAAELLGLPYTTVLDAIHRGNLRAYRRGRGHLKPRYVVALSDLRLYAARREP